MNGNNIHSSDQHQSTRFLDGNVFSRKIYNHNPNYPFFYSEGAEDPS